MLQIILTNSHTQCYVIVSVASNLIRVAQNGKSIVTSKVLVQLILHGIPETLAVIFFQHSAFKISDVLMQVPRLEYPPNVQIKIWYLFISDFAFRKLKTIF